MSNQIYSEAKKIFDKYNGSHFHMERDGEYQNYKKFKVPKEIEMVWNSQQRENIAKKLFSITDESERSSLFSQYCGMVNQAIDENGLQFILEYAKKNQKNLDSYTNVRIAESILNSVSRFSTELRKNAINIAIDLLTNIATTAFWVSDSYKVDGAFPEYATKGKIIDRVDRNIKYWTNEL